jgi:hypothetical protein
LDEEDDNAESNDDDNGRSKTITKKGKILAFALAKKAVNELQASGQGLRLRSSSSNPKVKAKAKAGVKPMAKPERQQK